MRNIWLNKIDRALRVLGYLPEIIEMFDEKEKESLIIDEYLFLLREHGDESMPLSLEEMAQSLIDYKRT